MSVRAFVPRVTAAALFAVGGAPAAALAPHGVSAQCQWIPVNAASGALVVVASASNTGTEAAVSTSVSCTVSASGMSHSVNTSVPGAHASAAGAFGDTPEHGYRTCWVGSVTYADGHVVTLAGCF